MIPGLCPERHAAPPFTALTSSDLGLRIAGNGSYQVIATCRGCGAVSSSIPHYRLESLGLRAVDLPVIADYRGSIGRCARRGCEQEAVEDHHFAPRQLFGEECEDWPRALLCVGHHQEWHRRMGGAA